MLRSASILRQIATLFIDPEANRCVLHRSATCKVRCYFAASCIYLVSTCYVMHRLCFKLLRSVSILGQFATSCIDSSPICYFLYRFGAHILEYARSASFLNQFSRFCIDFEPMCCVMYRIYANLLRCASIRGHLRSAMLRCQIAALCID